MNYYGGDKMSEIKIEKGSLVIGLVGGVAGTLLFQHYGKRVVEWYEEREKKKYEKFAEVLGKTLKEYLREKE